VGEWRQLNASKDNRSERYRFGDEGQRSSKKRADETFPYTVEKGHPPPKTCPVTNSIFTEKHVGRQEGNLGVAPPSNKRFRAKRRIEKADQKRENCQRLGCDRRTFNIEKGCRIVSRGRKHCWGQVPLVKTSTGARQSQRKKKGNYYHQ